MYYYTYVITHLKAHKSLLKRMKTINIPDDLHKKIKLQAVKDDTTVKDLIIELLESEFGKSKEQSNVEKIMGKKKNVL